VFLLFFWVLGLLELPVYMACVLKGAFNKVFFITYQFLLFIYFYLSAFRILDVLGDTISLNWIL
jgi:hypothetical protein